MTSESQQADAPPAAPAPFSIMKLFGFGKKEDQNEPKMEQITYAQSAALATLNNGGLPAFATLPGMDHAARYYTQKILNKLVEMRVGRDDSATRKVIDEYYAVALTEIKQQVYEILESEYPEKIVGEAADKLGKSISTGLMSIAASMVIAAFLYFDANAKKKTRSKRKTRRKTRKKSKRKLKNT